LGLISHRNNIKFKESMHEDLPLKKASRRVSGHGS